MSIKLVPGLLVNVSSRVEGGATYQRVDLDHHDEGGADVLRWETTRTIINKEEYEAAGKVRSKARSLVVGACIPTPFGFLICPLEKEAVLDERIAEAKALCETFNASSVHSKVKVTSIRGTIAETKAEAGDAVRAEVSALMAQLQAAIKAGEVSNIRDLASKATQMGKLLEQKSAARGSLDRAVAAARIIARDVKRAAEAGENAANVIEKANLSPIATARFAFDEGTFEEEQETTPEDALPSVEGARFAAVEGEQAEIDPGAVSAGVAILSALAEAIEEFGTYAFDDKGADEVLHVGPLLSRLEALEPAAAAQALAAVAKESTRSEELARFLLEAIDEKEPERFEAIYNAADNNLRLLIQQNFAVDGIGRPSAPEAPAAGTPETAGTGPEGPEGPTDAEEPGAPAPHVTPLLPFPGVSLFDEEEKT